MQAPAPRSSPSWRRSFEDAALTRQPAPVPATDAEGYVPRVSEADDSD